MENEETSKPDLEASFPFPRHRSPPEILWHYTTREGLLGILRHKSLHATDTRFLNDAEEHVHGMHLLEEVVQARLDATKDADRRIFLESVVHWCRQLIPSSSTFVFSLSASPDDLSQWRAYGGRGSAYAIGFKSESVEALASGPGWVGLRHCVYRHDEQRAFVEQFLDRWASDEQRLPQFAELREYESRLLGARTVVSLSQVASVLKHPKFESEDEWRLISLRNPKQPIDFRPARSLLVPYTIAGPAQSPEALGVHEVMVGPSPHRELEIVAITQLLQRWGFSNATATESRVPFRNW